MYKLRIKKFDVDGIHGLTKKEQTTPQSFRIKIKAKVAGERPLADKLSNTTDYRIIKKLAALHVTAKRYDLIETLGDKIIDAIFAQTQAQKVKIIIQKRNIWPDAIPATIITRRRLFRDLGLYDFDMREITEKLIVHGGVSLPILRDELRTELLAEARKLIYIDQPEDISHGLVRQQLASCDKIPDDSRVMTFKRQFSELVNYQLMRFGLTTLFTPQLDFNRITLQRYPAGSIGITPHHDGISLRNLICVFVLNGKAEFYLCKDRQGTQPRLLDSSPGNLIILRGPGFLGSTFEPFHYLKAIPDERFVLRFAHKHIKGQI